MKGAHREGSAFSHPPVVPMLTPVNSCPEIADLELPTMMYDVFILQLIKATRTTLTWISSSRRWATASAHISSRTSSCAAISAAVQILSTPARSSQRYCSLTLHPSPLFIVHRFGFKLFLNTTLAVMHLQLLPPRHGLGTQPVGKENSSNGWPLRWGPSHASHSLWMRICWQNLLSSQKRWLRAGCSLVMSSVVFCTVHSRWYIAEQNYMPTDTITMTHTGSNMGRRSFCL